MEGRAMADRQSRFCVLTVGRTGSTALMDALQRFDDIAVPGAIRLTYESLCDAAFRCVELVACIS